MAPKPEPRVVFFFGMALTLLAIMTWLSRDLAARGPPPTQANLPASTSNFVLSLQAVGVDQYGKANLRPDASLLQ